MLSIELTAGMGERLRAFLQSRNVGGDHLLFTRVYNPLREVLYLEDVPTCAELHFDHCGGTPAQEEVIQDLEDQLSLMDSLVESQAEEITRLRKEIETLRRANGYLLDEIEDLSDAEQELREGIRSVITNPVVIQALREEQSVPSAALRYLLDAAGMGQYGEGDEAYRDYEITV